MLIVRIQAAFRGFMARKRVRRIRESQGYKGNIMSNFQMSPNGQYNYDNPDVLVSLVSEG